MSDRAQANTRTRLTRERELFRRTEFVQKIERECLQNCLGLGPYLSYTSSFWIRLARSWSAAEARRRERDVEEGYEAGASNAARSQAEPVSEENFDENSERQCLQSGLRLGPALT